MLLVRPATIDDVPLLRKLIRELAEFERELDLCVIEEADLARDGFGEDPKFRALIAEWTGQPAGYALFFDNYSTWVGPHSTWKIFTFVRNFAEKELGRHCCPPLPI
jgi:hypothetical protein